MEFNDYQKAALKTQSKTGDPLLMGALGLGGETGEVVEVIMNAAQLAVEAGHVIDIVKKVIFHLHYLDTDKLKKELGDVLWYVACIAQAAYIPLDDVADTNIAKLKARYGDEFTPEKSIHRYSERDE